MTKKTDKELEAEEATLAAQEANAAALQAQIDELIEGKNIKPKGGKQSLRDFIAEKMAESDKRDKI
jgi:hypothetical protein